jgi:hypothetical protein
MMNNANSTWAVVVGIDAYDHFNHLTGAANDAVAAVGWLRRLSVPDGQIMLHAAPTEASDKAVNDLGMTVGGCTEPAIFESFQRLIEGQGGSKLFVFLSGHGVFEPGGERVFLTQEASETVLSNLGIAWYTKLLLGLPFERQIIVMDGCLNLPYSPAKRASFTGGQHPGVAPGPPRAEVLQAFCYGASQGERAQESDGRGIFSANLLTALDPDQPQSACVDIDDATGTVQLDLMRAVQKVAGPETTDQAGQMDRVQSPGIQITSMGKTPPVVPVAEFTPADPVRLTVSIGPDTALPDVTRVALWSEENDWRRVLPETWKKPIPPVYERHLPPNIGVTVRCTVRAGSQWIQPSSRDTHTAGDQEIEFDLQAGGSGGTDAQTVVVVDELGRFAPAITPKRQRRVEKALDDLDGSVDFEVDRGGVRFEIAGAPEQARRTASDIGRLITVDTDWSVRTTVDTSGAALPRTEVVELRITRSRALRLAGLLADEYVVTIGGEQRSPLGLADVPWVPAEGPTMISVELPWGTWTRRVVPSPGEDAVIELPRRIGVPPLRTMILRDPRGHPGHPLTVRTARADISGSPIVDAQGEAVGPELRTGHSPGSAWLGKVHCPSQKVSEPGRWRRFVEVQGLRLPLSETGPIAIYLGRLPRAEPLSTVETRAWDRLVGAGRLDMLSSHEAQKLAIGKWRDVLFGLAGAYACYAKREDKFLEETLENLRHLDPELPDLPLLEAGLDRRLGRRRKDVGKDLRPDAVPLFRWGIPMGVLAAHHYEQPELARNLEKIEARLVSSSSWTLWRA